MPAATRVVIDPILAAHGVNPDNTTMLPLASPAAAKALKDGEADVFVLIIELNAQLVQALLRDPTVRTYDRSIVDRAFSGERAAATPERLQRAGSTRRSSAQRRRSSTAQRPAA